MIALPLQQVLFHSGKIHLWILLLLLASCFHPGQMAKGQISSNELAGASATNLRAAAFFLTIAPDGRSTGMGDVGVASVPDLNSQHWNAAKYAFTEKRGGASFTYSPWVTNLLPDIHHLYLSGYYKIGQKNAVSGSLRYFSLGKIDFPNLSGIMMPFYRYELAGDLGYSRRFTDHLSGGLSIRYIHSDINPDQFTASGSNAKPGRSIAGDLGLYYQNDLTLGEKDAAWALGINISNIGTPISYTEDAEKTPIPTNLRIGGRFSIDLNENHSIAMHMDANKLLVPTLPVYNEDTLTGNLVLIRGKETPESVLGGMVQSLYDAPGVLQSDGTYSVFREELYEIAFGVGIEYWYHKVFAVRTGYHHEHSIKGNRRYVTLGIGGRYRFLIADISYLIATDGQNSPLHNTFRFTLATAY